MVKVGGETFLVVYSPYIQPVLYPVPTSFTWTFDDPTSGSVFQTSFQVLIISTNIDYNISMQTCAGEGFRYNNINKH
ncbi:hypothetical protein Hanom_Chr10g00926721 [Helianthus anomalus]